MSESERQGDSPRRPGAIRVSGGSPDGFVDEVTVQQKGSSSAGGARSYTLLAANESRGDLACHIPASAPHRFTVGKSPACDLRLEDQEVSRRHAALELRGDQLHVEDLGSTNGTFVNGVRVIEALLAGGETIRIGGTVLRVEATDDAAPSLIPAALRFGRVIGTSPQMRRLYPFCQRLAASTIPLIIEGETGTGKELLAESLHEQGVRAGGPFVVFDCTTVAPSLMEATLFGHEQGAFTGADKAQAGVFERAHGGTLFIDEIGDLALELQAKLLRAVERSEVRRIGGESFIKVDVRIMSATRRDLELAIQEGRFRDDLYHRLAVARIELPALRQRAGDVALLAQYFWSQLGGGPMPAGFVEGLGAHRWPGNVRELHNLVARTIALGDLAPVGRPPAGATESEQSGDAIEDVLSSELPFVRARDRVMTVFRQRFVERALLRHHGNVGKAAAAAGISRRYFDMIRERDRDES